MRQIDQIPGFGRNTASGLVMLMHPTGWVIDNEQTRAALKQLGSGAEHEAQVQASGFRWVVVRCGRLHPGDQRRRLGCRVRGVHVSRSSKLVGIGMVVNSTDVRSVVDG